VIPGDRFWNTVLFPVAGPMVRRLVRLRVTGAETLPTQGAVLLVANHQSMWDILALGAAQTRPIRYMAKAELFKFPPFAAVLRAGGTFPVRRGEPDRDALRTAHETLEAGGQVCVFIQGHRQEGFEEAKAGAGRMAVVEDADVVPVWIKSRGWRPGRHIVIRFGEPRRYERRPGRAAETYRQIADEIMGEIRRLAEGAP